jgi:DNA-binding response OmpR family regulator
MLILVCTPDPAAADALSSALRGDGHRVIAAVAIDRALAVARSEAGALEAAVLDLAFGAAACAAAAASIQGEARSAELIYLGGPDAAAALPHATVVARTGLPALIRSIATARAARPRAS